MLAVVLLWRLPLCLPLMAAHTYCIGACTVSLNATFGFPVTVGQLYSRSIISLYTSRCSSPMPEMMVSLLSGSRCTRKVGSWRWKRLMALLNCSRSLEFFGRIDSEITGSGTNLVGCKKRREEKRREERGGGGRQGERESVCVCVSARVRVPCSSCNFHMRYTYSNAHTRKWADTYMDSMVSFWLPSVNVSPDEHSRPNIAQISPACTCGHMGERVCVCVSE